MSDILRERLSLALDQSAEAQRQIAALQTEHGKMQAQLEIERLNHQKTQQELQRLKDEHTEEIRIHRAVELRRGSRTGGKWTVFCPKCHMPAAMPMEHDAYPLCSDGSCHWSSDITRHEVERFISQL